MLTRLATYPFLLFLIQVEILLVAMTSMDICYQVDENQPRYVFPSLLPVLDPAETHQVFGRKKAGADQVVFGRRFALQDARGFPPTLLLCLFRRLHALADPVELVRRDHFFFVLFGVEVMVRFNKSLVGTRSSTVSVASSLDLAVCAPMDNLDVACCALDRVALELALTLASDAQFHAVHLGKRGFTLQRPADDDPLTCRLEVDNDLGPLVWADPVASEPSAAAAAITVVPEQYFAGGHGVVANAARQQFLEGVDGLRGKWLGGLPGDSVRPQCELVSAAQLVVLFERNLLHLLCDPFWVSELLPSTLPECLLNPPRRFGHVPRSTFQLPDLSGFGLMLLFGESDGAVDADGTPLPWLDCKGNLEELRTQLTKKYRFDKAESQVWADADTVKAKARKLGKECGIMERDQQPTARVVIACAGHGSITDLGFVLHVGPKLLLLVKDVLGEFARAVLQQTGADQVATPVLVVVDACHSGQAINDLSQPWVSDGDDDPSPSAAAAAASPSAASKFAALTVLASSMPSQASQELVGLGVARSVFFESILRGMGGAALEVHAEQQTLLLTHHSLREHVARCFGLRGDGTADVAQRPVVYPDLQTDLPRSMVVGAHPLPENDPERLNFWNHVQQLQASDELRRDLRRLLELLSSNGLLDKTD